MIIAEFFVYFLVFMFGASIFSFINVVNYRLPRKMNIIGTRSICPSCGNIISLKEMIPVLSWVLLKGRCSACSGKISPVDCVIEGIGGVLALLCVYHFGGILGGVDTYVKAGIYFFMLAILTSVAVIDFKTMEIPNQLVVALFVVAVLSVFFFKDLKMSERIIGFFAVSGFMFIVSMIIPGAFGGGDIKFMAPVGFLIGWRISIISFVFAVFIGGIYGIYLLARKKKNRKDQFAFGPSLCMGVFISVFWGETIFQWYKGLIIR